MTEQFREPVTLANCDQEPIHIPGSIQSHGVLLALEEPSLLVRLASANVEAFLGTTHAALVDQPLALALDDASVATIMEVQKLGTLRDHNPLKLSARRGGRLFDGILHRSSGLLVVELEPATSADDLSFGQFYRRVRRSVARLRETERVLDLAELAAQEIRSLTGFDRVMVYRFASDASGEVIAESKRDDLETFLGLHYPASDIPAQARRLYTINWLRLIADVSYQPVPVLPARTGTDAEPLDMSHAVLRSVSPVHIEYLKNMGVGASMSISLVVDEKLWGLVACHHYERYFVPYEARAAGEFLGEALSWQIAARERADAFEEKAEAQRVLAKLVERMSASSNPTLELAGDDSPLPKLVGAASAVVHCQGKLATTGAVPSAEQLRGFVEWLASRLVDDQPFVSEALRLEHPSAPELTDVAAVLVVPISVEERHFLIWLRPEVTRTINWGGNPEKQVEVKGGVPRLSPRGSFALWKETVRGHGEPWKPSDIEVAVELKQGILGGIEQRAAELAKLNEELRASNFAKDEFLATVSHELRTPLNAMLGWLSLLESGELPLSKRVQAMETVTRNARVQAQLVEDLLDVSRIVSGKMRLDVQPVDPMEVVEAALATVQPAAAAKGIRIQPVLDPNAGPVMGDPSRLQQVLWNLLTNAVKFTPKDGRIQVRLQRVDSSIEIGVTDSGSGIRPEFLPHVFDRFRQSNGAITRSHKGLGLGLSIVKHLVELHGGQVVALSDGEGQGSTFTVRLPIASLRPPAIERKGAAAEPRGAAVSSGLESRAELAGLRMLVVDDEPDARELVTTLLEGSGVEVTAAGSAEEALGLIPRIRPDILISDIGMPKVDGYELVQRLRQLPAEAGGRTLAVALTAFARSEDRSRAFLAGFDMYLPKPVDPGELMALVVSLNQRLKGDLDRVTPSLPPPSSALPASARPLSDLKVLVVDGDADARADVVRTLAAAGALVSACDSAESALRQFEALEPHVMVCSLELPDRDGTRLLRDLRLRDGHRTTPAIALTRDGSTEEARLAILSGFQAHVEKSAAIDGLVARVAKLSAWSFRKTST